MTKELLNQREEELFFFLFDQEKPLTTREMGERLDRKRWNNVTLFRTVKSLEEKKYLTVTGFERSNTQYARRFVPAMTRAEYAAKLLIAKGYGAEDMDMIVQAVIHSFAAKKKSSKK